ncbi:hypothetical protein P7K49_023043 [Saguinus oedipus]|uniref:CLEC16A/TT9 C-terminal domain-containing protein n=1 Tax=Saguinus oedipus TaxID=9490 RepID=A0ABQ9UKH5_SAGOE|nr:hypothetical protein P7K49_023043 [Saguinus oedipus]
MKALLWGICIIDSLRLEYLLNDCCMTSQQSVPWLVSPLDSSFPRKSLPLICLCPQCLVLDQEHSCVLKSCTKGSQHPMYRLERESVHLCAPQGSCMPLLFSRPFLDMVYHALDSPDDDYHALFVLCLLYAMSHNKGMDPEKLERIQLPVPNVAEKNTYNHPLAERLIRIMNNAAQPGAHLGWEDPAGDAGAELPAFEAASPDKCWLHHEGRAPGLSGGDALSPPPSCTGAKGEGQEDGRAAAGIQMGALAHGVISH